MGIFNYAVTFHTRGGAVVRSNTLADFWTSTNIPPYAEVFDPRVVYDPYHHRWISVAVTDRQSTNSRVLIGVSLTSNPTNGWNLRETKADPNNLRWADYPTIGFNKNWIVVQANMGPNDTNVVGIHSHIYVFNKTNLYGGGFTAPTMFVQTNSETAGSEVPTITYDTNLSTMYLLQSANSNTNAAGYLRLFSITGSIGAEVLNYQTNPVYIRVDEPWAHMYTNQYWQNWWCCFAPQSNTTELIGTVVDSRLANVIYRNGSLWTAQTIFLPTNNVARRSSIQWWQIKPDTAEVVQRGRINDPAGINYYAFGSIAVNRFNDVLIGYSSFSTNQYGSANYSFRAFYDTLGQMRSPRIYKAGEGLFTRQTRWGDYSATVVDPLNDTDLWTIQEYAGPYVGVDVPDSHAGTRWAHVALPVPANDAFSAAVSISGAQGSTNGTTIRATRESGEPNHSGHANTPSVWHSWTAPSSGNVEFALTNAMVSGFDTSLAVYTGSSVGNLTSVTNRYGVAPKVTFSATSGVTYRIAISGYGGSSGDYTLFWLQPTAPYFTEHPQTTNTVVGENVTLSSVAIGIPGPAYQWRQEGTNLAGKTSASLALTGVQLWQGTNYTVVASNSSGMATSSVASLIIHGDSAARLSLFAMETNAFRLHISGVTNRSYVVQTSTNLNSATNWYTIHTNFVSFWYTNYPTTGDLRRFYRSITNN